MTEGWIILGVGRWKACALDERSLFLLLPANHDGVVMVWRRGVGRQLMFSSAKEDTDNDGSERVQVMGVALAAGGVLQGIRVLALFP